MRLAILPVVLVLSACGSDPDDLSGATTDAADGAGTADDGADTAGTADGAAGTADDGAGTADDDDDDDADDDDDDDDDDAQTGMEVYLSLCAPCHGADGEGTELGYELRHPDRGHATWVVRNGRPGDEFEDAAMAAFSPEAVSDAQLDEIFDWLDGFPQPTGGEALYLDYCRNCHGEDPWQGGVAAEDIGEKDFDDLLERVREGAGGTNYGSRGQYMTSFDPSVLSDDALAEIADWFGTL